ncbi:hypothetical protein JX266_011097 [Neoarthrinium moseri]|nr:hypothetical protein JX266_011097 [Neoarthrinium moseri]
MRSLANKRAIITGGSRGIGLAIARLFASEGTSVTLVGRDEARLSSALDSLSAGEQQHHHQPPARHNSYAFDVSSIDGWTAMLNDMKQMQQNVDILVNAAGITQQSLLYKSDPAENQRIINTNLMGTIFGCQSVSQQMIRQKSGCIVNISSLLAVQGGLGASVYAASKAGIVGLTRSFALEVGRFGVRVNVLLPGYIQTDMTKPIHVAMDEKGNLSASIPLRRLGTAEEVADAAAFLVKNPYAHNAVLNLDGGLSAA